MTSVDKDRTIRPLALGIVWREENPSRQITQREILVFEAYDHVKEETYYRPLGGGIQFGERSQQALRREFQEELNVELATVRYITTMENIFTCNGKPGHEIVLLYKVTLADDSYYERDTLTVHEENEILTARWLPLYRFPAEGLPLYPEGLFELLTSGDTAQ